MSSFTNNPLTNNMVRVGSNIPQSHSGLFGNFGMGNKFSNFNHGANGNPLGAPGGMHAKYAGLLGQLQNPVFGNSQGFTDGFLGQIGGGRFGVGHSNNGLPQNPMPNGMPGGMANLSPIMLQQLGGQQYGQANVLPGRGIRLGRRDGQDLRDIK